MEKIAKQIVVNIIIIFLSVLVIIIAKSYAANKLVFDTNSLFGPDIVFVIISSVCTMIGWRFVESIKAHWIYNLIVGVFLFLWTIVYGFNIAGSNDFVIKCTWGVVFTAIIIYIIETVIICWHFKNNNSFDERDSLG